MKIVSHIVSILSLKDTIVIEKDDINQNTVTFLHITNQIYLPLKVNTNAYTVLMEDKPLLWQIPQILNVLLSKTVLSPESNHLVQDT